jgi:hypothetical protein
VDDASATAVSRVVYLERDEKAIARERRYWWDSCIKPHIAHERIRQLSHRPRSMSLIDDSVSDNKFSLV